MSTKAAIAKEARTLMMTEYQGVLSTHSVDAPGYPFGSIVPYCFNRKGRAVLLISQIAQHTKNIEANPQISLIATEGQADDMQTVGRITYLADAMILADPDSDTPARYYRYYPHAQDYHKTHDFEFYYLDLLRVRYIGGFGKIHWVEPKDFLIPNPFSYDEETSMIEHMNKDHIEAMKHYCQTNNIVFEDGNEPSMVGIDSEGFHLRVAARIHRINFAESVSTPKQIREILVAMAKR